MIKLEPQEREEKKSDRKPSDQPLDKWLIDQAKDIKNGDDADQSDKTRIQLIIQMCRKFRGLTPSDKFGMFENGNWLEHPDMAELVGGSNVFQSLVRGAEANFTQARIRLDISPATNDFNARSAQKVTRGIYDILGRRDWNELAESQMFYASVLKLNYWILSRFNKSADGYAVPLPQFSPQTMETPGKAICHQCDAVNPFEGYEMECPKCGSSEFTITQDQQSEELSLIDKFENTPGGSVETIIADSLDCSIDSTHGVPNDVEGAQWFEFRQLVHKNELKKLFPHLKLENNPDWSYSTQWKIALQRYKSSAVQPESGKKDKMMYELREIWIDEAKAEEYVAPVDQEVLGVKIKQGQSLAEVMEQGTCYAVVNDELAYIHDEDKKDVATGGSWLPDPVSPYGLGVSSGLEIQRKVNILDNINMDGINRAMRGSIVYDPEAISGSHLEGSNSNIPLRAGFNTQNKALDTFFTELSTSGLSSDAVGYLQKQEDDMQKIMGVPDAAIGQSDTNNQTLGGQALLAQRAVGLLIPAKKSQAYAMEKWILHQCKLIQQFYSVERIQQEFGSAYGETWMDEEVEAFKEAKLDTVLSVAYIEGSEVPQTKQEKEAKLYGLLQTGALPPENVIDIMGKITEVAGLEEFDIGNVQSNKTLAHKRWTMLSEVPDEADVMYQELESQMLDPMTGMRAMDETGQPLPNPMVMQVLASPEFTINPDAEDHNFQIEFWNDKIRSMIGGGFAKAAAVAMVQAHKQAMLSGQQEQAMMGQLAGAPAEISRALVESELSQELAPPMEEAAPKEAESGGGIGG